MKNTPSAVPPVVPSPAVSADRDKEFFKHTTDPDPTLAADPNGTLVSPVAPVAPSTEQEIAARELANGGGPLVTRIEPVEVQPERVGPEGPRVETRDGGKFVAGTDIVVGGPSQQ